ncbi:MAG: HAMP domain-containing histidine kinase [Lachnospiraceae bacterium]|jgi:signal transduction histidine kinase|nr:HAMP domain-containing histidine kinase [Lachnospiraceae bacterium]
MNIGWIFNNKLLKRLDGMLDDALAGTFKAESYDEQLISKIESKMSTFLERSRLRREHIETEQERVHTLISDISHQTKTPIANISLYCGLLAEQSLTDDQTHLAGQIANNANKLDFLIKALVKTSRLESGIIAIKPVAGSVTAMIDQAIAEGLGHASGKHIKLSFTPCEETIVAMMDVRWCTEALLNIIDNAIKYTPQNGKVDIKVTEYEMFVRIDVSDTGRGIREEDLPKVFERFWRAAESADQPGVGVGLYLAREIVIACGGYIKVASLRGNGSVFSLFLARPYSENTD